MADDDIPKPYFDILRSDIAAVNKRLDGLVSTDLFAAEQRRVTEKFDNMGRDIVTEAASRVSDVNDVRRDLADNILATKANAEKIESRRVALRQGLQVAGASAAIASILGLIYAIVANALHLG